MKGVINLFHIIFVVALFIYLGFNIYNQRKMDQNIGVLLIVLAIVIFLYHSYRFYTVTK